MSIMHAARANIHAAKRHFIAGGGVIITEAPRGERTRVGRYTTVNRAVTADAGAEWAELVRKVRMWRNRYPRQTFYLLEETHDKEAICQ